MAKKIKLLLFIFTLILAGFVFASKAYAADSEITCNPNGCSDVGPIFNESGLAPGATVSKTLKVTNGYSEWRSFALELQGSNYSDSVPSMADELTVTINDKTNNVPVYGPKTITEWKADGLVHLGGFDPGATRIFEINVVFNNVGNLHQNQKLTFDLKVGFEELGAGQPSVLGISTQISGKTPVNRLLGVLTENLPQEVALPGVLGASCNANYYPWWIPLAIQLLLIMILTNRAKVDKWSRRKYFVYGLAIAILSQFANKFLGCNCAVSGLCNYYLLFNLGILFASLANVHFFQKDS